MTHPTSTPPQPTTQRRRFADWLVSAGALTGAQFETATQSRKSRPNIPFGRICVELGFLSSRQLDGLLAEYRQSLPLGELLVREGWITRDQLSHVVRVQQQTGERLGSILVNLGYLSEEQLCEALSRQYDLPFLHLGNTTPEPGLASTLNPTYAAQHRAVPLSKIGRRLSVAVDDPTVRGWTEDLARATGLEIVPFLTAPSSLNSFYERLYGRAPANPGTKEESPAPRGTAAPTPGSGPGDNGVSSAAGAETDDLPPVLRELRSAETGGYELEVIEEEELDFRKSKYAATTEDSPVVQTLVQKLIARALALGASDIHLEVDVDGPRIRFRVDGMLLTHSLGGEHDRNYRLNHRSVVSRLKILCHLDITEKRRPQDGSFRIFTRRSGKVGAVDFRLSTLPGRFGEGVVLRVLDDARAPGSLESLGMTPEVEAQFRSLIQRPLGILLITGPTGSGKSSTLYAALRTIYRPELKILTVEDPIEYTHPGIVQTEVNPAIDNTFARYLRAFLRQDPDVIMVGEIRDAETAEMAQRAALTGHLLLSTLHTTCATASIHRLLDLAVDANSIASTLIGVMAQRLVRRNCPHCLEPYAPAPELIAEWFEAPPDFSWKRGHGCRECHNTGFSGRMAVAELWVPSAADLVLIRKRAPHDEIREEVLKQMPSLGEDALLKAVQGKTTLEEATRVAPYDDIRYVRTQGAGER